MRRSLAVLFHIVWKQRKLGLSCFSENFEHVREKLTISPLPRNMNPAYHEGRRKSRASALQIRYGGRPDVLYTDAAEDPRKKAHTTVAVMEDGIPHSCCTIPSTDTQEAEEAAIALVLHRPRMGVIVSDS